MLKFIKQGYMTLLCFGGSLETKSISSNNRPCMNC